VPSYVSLLFDRFSLHLQESGLISPSAKVLVGYSGGADSTCLLHLLSRLGGQVVAAHLHHGQRPEAETELVLCQAFAEGLGVGFAAGRADVPMIAKQRKIGIEEAGREARYSFFRQAAAQFDCDLIATAHTRNDHVETVILHLTRGSGLTGLAGIPAKRQELVRPLLPFSREETRAYCAQHGLWTHDDPANGDLAFSRVRIRNVVLPELRKLNPAVDEAIERLAGMASEADGFLNSSAAALLEHAEVPLNGELRFLTDRVEATFNAAALRRVAPILVRTAIRLAAHSIGGAATFAQAELAAAGILAGESGSQTLEGGSIAIEWSADSMTVRELQPPEPFRYPLTVPGETISEVFGWQFQAWREPGPESEPVRASLAAELDAAKIKGPLYFRSLEPGDKMAPLGFDHERKLSDLLGELKLTPAARRLIPIVCDMTGPVWVPGVCVHERTRPNGGPVIKLRFGPFDQAT
jgi:tRNA(Ile)-lysidine synthase